MQLKQLIQHFPEIELKGEETVTFTGIYADSRQVTPGSLFIARRGALHDGAHYSAAAVAAGAAVLVSDHYQSDFASIPQLVTPHIAALEPRLAAAYYGFPSEKLFTVGITGTNGKTTTAYLIRYLLEQLQCRPCGQIGTVEYRVGARIYPATHTTPEPCVLQKLLHEMLQEGCQSVVMEITSHAIAQRRSEMVECDVAIFTNLTQDHLDYHGTMEHYAATKQRLFNTLSPLPKSAVGIPKRALINLDDPYGCYMSAQCPVPLLTYAIEQPADLMAHQIRSTIRTTECVLTFAGQQVPLTLPLIGTFNVYNALAATGALLAAGYSLEAIAATLKQVPAVVGRMEYVPNALNRALYVDFCHTPDALQKALETLRPLTTGRLIVLFGCGGERDTTKRPLMGAVCERYADLLVVTSDNPRSEEPVAIIQDVVSGLQKPHHALIEPDRHQALRLAIQLMQSGDTLLLAGKGHEQYQQIGLQKLPFHDGEIAAQVCQELFLSTF